MSAAQLTETQLPLQHCWLGPHIDTHEPSALQVSHGPHNKSPTGDCPPVFGNSPAPVSGRVAPTAAVVEGAHWAHMSKGAHLPLQQA